MPHSATLLLSGTYKRALELAKKAHAGQKRASGSPYVEHPKAVAEILKTIFADDETLTAALLHDVVEDTSITHKQIKKHFGSTVDRLVAGVTKISKIEKHIDASERQMYSIRKMLNAMGKDIRVIFIKLADRMHNMQTIHFLPKYKQQRIARETLDVFCPLTNLLGLWDWYQELTNRAFKVLWPTEYSAIKKKHNQIVKEKKDALERWSNRLKSSLESAGYNNMEVSLVKRHFHSIHESTHGQEILLQHIETFYRIHVRVSSYEDCYRILGDIHQFALPIPNHIHDYVSQPKPNGYQALHTTVTTSLGNPIKIIIQTEEMEKIAHFGAALPYQNTGKNRWKELPSWIMAMTSLEKTQNDLNHFFHALQTEIFGDRCRVHIVGKKKRFIDIPCTASILDAAYYESPTVGSRIRDAIVNGKQISLKQMIRDGDVIEFIEAKKGNIRSTRDIFITHTSLAQTCLIEELSQQSERIRVQQGMEFLKEAFEITIDPLFSITWKKEVRDAIKPNKQTLMDIGAGLVDPFTAMEDNTVAADFFLVDPTCFSIAGGIPPSQKFRFVLRAPFEDLRSGGIIGVHASPDIIDLLPIAQFEKDRKKTDAKEILSLHILNPDLLQHPLYFALSWEFAPHSNPVHTLSSLQSMLDTPARLTSFEEGRISVVFHTNSLDTIRTAFEFLSSSPEVLSIYRISP